MLVTQYTAASQNAPEAGDSEDRCVVDHHLEFGIV